jgi:GNAT superfamily N-acetyltransferase
MALRNSLWNALRSCASPFGELVCATFFERTLVDAIPAAENRLGATLRLADEDDIDAICRLYVRDAWLWLGDGADDGSARRHYLDRLQRGELCYIAEVEDRIAHVNWTCQRWGDALPGQPIRLRAGEVYTTDAFTPEPFRGKGIHALVLGTMLNDARKRGARQAFTMGRVDRPAALKGLIALGWRECGRIVYFIPRGGARALFTLRTGYTEPLFRGETPMEQA